MPSLNLPELLVIGFLAIVFFGQKKLPEAARSMGLAFKSFKQEISEAVAPVEAVKDDVNSMSTDISKSVTKLQEDVAKSTSQIEESMKLATSK
jgi:TatA/E family protein of Tat protein translocase